MYLLQIKDDQTTICLFLSQLTKALPSGFQAQVTTAALWRINVKIGINNKPYTGCIKKTEQI